MEPVRGALEESGLAVTWCDEALRDPGTWDAVLREHNELVEKTRSFGVPTIILDGGDGPAIFGPVIADVPTDEDAVELWRHVTWLARYENFAELKRDRIHPPDLPALAWYRASAKQAGKTDPPTAADHPAGWPLPGGRPSQHPDFLKDGQ